jgi:hypothetical protein
VSEPTTDDSDIDAGSDKMNRCCVSKRMWGDVFSGQRWDLLGCGFDILIQFEADACRPQWTPVAIDEYWLIVWARLALQ